MAKKEKIVAVDDIKHGRESYRKGKTYEVDSELAAYFVSMGWARDPSGKRHPDPRDESLPIRNKGDDVVLRPHDSTIGHAGTEGK